MVVAAEKKSKKAEVEKAEDVFDVMDRLYDVFNATSAALGPNPDMSTPEARALAATLAALGESIAKVDERAKVYSDEHGLRQAYQHAAAKEAERDPVGFMTAARLKEKEAAEAQKKKKGLKVVQGGAGQKAA